MVVEGALKLFAFLNYKKYLNCVQQNFWKNKHYENKFDPARFLFPNTVDFANVIINIYVCKKRRQKH